MGLFSGETQINTASTVYNLAGPEKGRPDVMRAIIVRSLLSNDKASMGQQLTGALLNGTGMKLRRYYRWADSNYVFDKAKGSVNFDNDLPTAQVYSGLKSLVTFGPNTTPRIIKASIGSGNPTYWAEEWIVQNRPDIDTDEIGTTGWSIDYDRDTFEILLQIPNEPEVRIPAPADFLWVQESENNELMYVVYRHEVKQTDGSYSFSIPKLLTYRMGNGNVVMDNLSRQTFDYGDFFPAIPLRIYNKSIDDPFYSNHYDSVSEAFDKLTGGNIEDILQEIEDSPSVNDIDHAYVVPAVNLGTKDKVGRKYLFNFLRGLITEQKWTKADAKAHTAHVEESYATNWRRRGSQFYGERNAFGTYDQRLTHPNYGTDLAQDPPFLGPPPMSEIRMKLPTGTQFDMRVQWLFIKETEQVGNCKRFDGTARKKANKGDYWSWVGSNYIVKTAVLARDTEVIRDQYFDRIYFFHQHSKYHYTKLEIVGLRHYNYTYLVNPVQTSSTVSILSEEGEEESSFLIPLHYPTFKSLGLPKETQLSTVSTYLVLNSYEKVKIPWYATGFFKFVIIVASIALSLPTGGQSLAAGAGILGGNLAIGTALGFTATAAAVVGAIANYIAAVIVTQLITIGAQKLLGDELGSIVGAIASFFTIGYLQGFQATGTFSMDWGRIMNVENIMKVTNSATSAYSKFLGEETQDIVNQIDVGSELYQDQLENIQNMSEEILGMTNGVIDPMMFTDSTEYFGESSEAFLNRTLLTGTDIAFLTHAMIEKFADISLELPKPNR